MEMVGLRERTALTRIEAGEIRDTADVGWFEAVFGRRRKRRDPVEEERMAVDEWAESESAFQNAGYLFNRRRNQTNAAADVLSLGSHTGNNLIYPFISLNTSDTASFS